MKTSTKVFAFSSVWYGMALVFWLVGRSITQTEWEGLKQSVFYGTTLDIYPTYNWAHYASLAAVMVTIGITIGGALLTKQEA